MKEPMETFWIVVVALALVAMADGISTVRFLRLGYTEGNPIFGRHPSSFKVFALGGAIVGAEVLVGLAILRFLPGWTLVVTHGLAAQAGIHLWLTWKNFRLK